MFETTEKTGQLLIRDNGNFRFRMLELADASLVEKKNKQVVKGWRHYFKLEHQFKGFGRIPPGMYTLCHERDIVYDPYNVLSEAEKPEKDLSHGLFDRRGISEVAQSKCYRHEHQKLSGGMIDKVIWPLIIIVTLFGVAIFWHWIPK